MPKTNNCLYNCTWNDGHCLIVQGPIKEPKHKQGTVIGTPVVIKDTQHPNDHLNGKVGDIRSFDKKSK